MFERSKARDPVVKVGFGSSPDCASTLTAAACRTAHEQMSENRKREGRKERHAESSINIRCRRDEEEDCSNDDDILLNLKQSEIKTNSVTSNSVSLGTTCEISGPNNVAPNSHAISFIQ